MLAVLDQEVADALQIERHFRDQGAVHVGQIGGEQRCLAGVAAEQLDHADALMRARRWCARRVMASTVRVTAVEKPMQ